MEGNTNKLWTAESFLKVFDVLQKIISVDNEVKEDPLKLAKFIAEVGPEICSATLGVSIEEIREKPLSWIVSTTMAILVANIEDLKQMNQGLGKIREFTVLN